MAVAVVQEDVLAFRPEDAQDPTLYSFNPTINEKNELLPASPILDGDERCLLHTEKGLLPCITR